MHSRSDRVTPSPGGSGSSRGRRAEPSLLALQQVVGNAAVGQMLARKPKPKTQQKPAGKAGAKPPAHKKYGLSDQEMKWDVPMLIGHAHDAEQQHNLPHAAALLERVYELTKGRDVALQLYKLYKQIGDTDEATRWLDIGHGKSTSDEPPVSYQSI